MVATSVNPADGSSGGRDRSDGGDPDRILSVISPVSALVLHDRDAELIVLVMAFWLAALLGLTMMVTGITQDRVHGTERHGLD
jgi:hypothetical protein